LQILGTAAARARARALTVRVTPEIRDRARAGRFAFVHDRGPDIAAGICVVDRVFTLDLVQQALAEAGDNRPAHEETSDASLARRSALQPLLAAG
jgi:hypothetical protein